MSLRSRVGVVAIGRNEGERLVGCLNSVASTDAVVVYVDSGSSDGSPERARDLGAHVVPLDLSISFTAARARNEGFRALAQLAPDVRYVQFVDGDCELVSGWLAAAMAFLEEHADVAVVCGRRRERYPEASIYNRLCDFEWDTPIGDAKACGGDAMLRADAFIQASGFRETLIAGEEPELCVRLRALGWKVHRVDREMTLHDAAMTRFSQWWKRSVRAGYAFAEGAHLHGAAPERHWLREYRRAMFWGLLLPLLIAAAAILVGASALLLVLLYPAQVFSIWMRAAGQGKARLARAAFLVFGKFAEAWGALRFHFNRWTQQPAVLIEYK